MVVITLIFGFIPVLFLYFHYQSESSINNGFTRTFRHLVEIEAILDLQYSGYYFSGHRNHSIFLGHTGAPAHIKEIDLLDDNATDHTLSIELNSFNNLQWQALVVQVEFPYVYYAAGPNGLIFKRHLSTETESRNFKVQIDSLYFDRFSVFQDSLIFIRNYDDSLKQNVISEFQKNNTKNTIYIPDKQADGIFCTDGVLLDNNNKLVYLFYYRNQFQVIDINQSLKGKRKTIDTNSIAKIKLKYINDSLQLTLAEPPLRVNKSGYLSDRYLFVNSVIKADNESAKQFRNNSVIDQYDLESGIYMQSYYLPKHLNRRTEHFMYIKGRFIGIYNDQLVIMNISKV